MSSHVAVSSESETSSRGRIYRPLPRLLHGVVVAATKRMDSRSLEIVQVGLDTKEEDIVFPRVSFGLLHVSVPSIVGDLFAMPVDGPPRRAELIILLGKWRTKTYVAFQLAILRSTPLNVQLPPNHLAISCTLPPPHNLLLSNFFKSMAYQSAIQTMWSYRCTKNRSAGMHIFSSFISRQPAGLVAWLFSQKRKEPREIRFVSLTSTVSGESTTQPIWHPIRTEPCRSFGRSELVSLAGYSVSNLHSSDAEVVDIYETRDGRKQEPPMARVVADRDGRQPRHLMYLSPSSDALVAFKEQTLYVQYYQ
ncbi:hypothetical protein C8R43DRAFT_1106491 [Mycena crocata]|nr:hypothetical protein C8R43DRAFT_1106491 [Mycena crocata]